MKISCIMPCNRPEDLPRANEIFNAQTYDDKELIIINGEGSIGAKRNKAIEICTGSIITHFDSDDYYAPNYLTLVAAHLALTGADVTGLSKAYFYQREPLAAWLYDYAGTQPYVIGSGMMYRKSVWERNKFKDINEGEDKHFLANAGRIIPHNFISGFCAFIHGKNTASQKTLSSMKAISPEYLLKTIPNLY